MKMKSTIITLNIAMMAVSSQLLAVQIAYDSFGYSTGESLNGQNGGSGWSAGWSDRESPAADSLTTGSGLTYGNLVVGGNGAFTDGASTQLNYRYIDTSGSSIAATNGLLNGNSELGVDGTTIWISYLIRRDAATANDTNFFGISLYKAGDVDAGIMAPRTPTSSDGGAWMLSTSTRESTGVSIVDDETYFFAVKVEFTPGNDLVSLYVDPDLTLADPGAANASLSIVGLEFSGFRIAGVSGANYSVDEFRMGTTYSDVSPTIPEPGLWAVLAGVLSLGLVAWRRRP